MDNGYIQATNGEIGTVCSLSSDELINNDEYFQELYEGFAKLYDPVVSEREKQHYENIYEEDKEYYETLIRQINEYNEAQKFKPDVPYKVKNYDDYLLQLRRESGLPDDAPVMICPSAIYLTEKQLKGLKIDDFLRKFGKK